MWMVDVNDNGLQAGSQPKSLGLVWGSASTWCWVCIHQINWLNSCYGSATMTALNIIVVLILSVFFWYIFKSDVLKHYCWIYCRFTMLMCSCHFYLTCQTFKLFLLLNAYSYGWRVIMGMCSICKRVGVEWNGSADSVVCCDNINIIFDTFFLAMKDYTLDSRGDVGLWWVSFWHSISGYFLLINKCLNQLGLLFLSDMSINACWMMIYWQLCFNGILLMWLVLL